MPRQSTKSQDDQQSRFDRIVDWLKQNRARIEGPVRVQLTFNCAGGRIGTEIKEGGEA